MTGGQVIQQPQPAGQDHKETNKHEEGYKATAPGHGYDRSMGSNAKHGAGSGGNKGGDGKGGGILFQNHHCGFRGDSRWIGLSVFDSKENSRGDVIVGGCESGSLYVIENAQYMQ